MIPRDILYVLPSISKLSAFIYGLSHFEAEKGNIYRNGHQEKKSGPPDNQTADEKWQTILKSKETVGKNCRTPVGNTTNHSPWYVYFYIKNWKD